MNYLVHLHLSGSDPETMIGNFMGDFVKGILGDRYPEGIRDGLVLHRQIDTFAQNHPIFHRSRSRLSRQFGLYRGVMVDLFYDHFLAVEWDAWSIEPFEPWLVRMRMIIEEHRPLLPERLQGLVPVIFGELLSSYREVNGIGHALERMSQRVRRPNPLAGGWEELVGNYEGLRDDFRGFVPSAQDFVRERLLMRPFTATQACAR